MPTHAVPEPEPHWPPRSPHEALLSTPRGRERMRRLAEQASRSPSSPSKGASKPLLTRSHSHNLGAMTHADDDEPDLDLDDTEDEETLQLQLAAIQAKLKLKKVQAAKAKKAHVSDAQSSDAHPVLPDFRPVREPLTSARSQAIVDSLRSSIAVRPQSQGGVQVPASPVKRAQTAMDITSPSRVRLGIDKGLRAKDVSLKRAPSLKTAHGTDKGVQGNYLRRANTPAPSGYSSPERPTSFSERLLAARKEEVARRNQMEKIQQIRSKSFHLGKHEMEELKSNAAELPDAPVLEEQYSREEVIAGAGIKRSVSMTGPPRQAPGETESQATKRGNTRKPKVSPSEVPEAEASAFEPYSSIHLKKRIIPHLTLTRNLAGKKTYTIPDLLKHVKAPDYELPDIEQDVVVFGILASKSDPKTHKFPENRVREKTDVQQANAKYMVLTLVDLKWEIELFLFNSGFERFWKLTPGTLIAILNPTIMAPPAARKDTGRFSLVISSDMDTVLEVGVARDLGFCKSVKKDGLLCSSWVNSKRTEYCEFHMNLALSKKRLARQEVNAFDTGLGPKRHNSQRLHNWEAHANDPGKKHRGNYDRDTQSAFFIRKPSAANMMDNEVLGGEFGRVASTIERSEALRRRLATEEKERDLMKKLSEAGKGAGKEYMAAQMQRASMAGHSTPPRAGTAATSVYNEAKPQVDAKSLGLVADRNSKIHLSPVKRKRVESALSNRGSVAGSTVSGPTAPKASALGWGGQLKNKLSRMREGEKLNGTKVDDENEYPGDAGKDVRSPARKKTRFVTEKGIRIAGRESLGEELASSSSSGGMIPRRTQTPAEPRPHHPRMMYLDDEDDEEELIILR